MLQLLASPDFQLLIRMYDDCDCGSGMYRKSCCHWSAPREEGGVLWPQLHCCTCPNAADPFTNPQVGKPPPASVAFTKRLLQIVITGTLAYSGCRAETFCIPLQCRWGLCNPIYCASRARRGREPTPVSPDPSSVRLISAHIIRL